MATLGLFDPEARQEALFDATVIEVGRFDPELIDAAAGGGAQTATAAPSILLSLAPNASATLGATAAPSITLSLGETALVVAFATATPSITLSLGETALVIALAQATPSITLSLAPNASATLRAQATPSITLSLAPVGVWVARAQATPSITLSLAPNASATLGATATPSITLSLAPSALKIGLATATPSITLSLAASSASLATAAPSITLSLAPSGRVIALATATPSIKLSLGPVGLKIGLATAAPSILLSLAPAATRVLVGTATPSILLTLAAETSGVATIEAHTVSPPGISITDSFDRADNPSSLGTADTGQVWSPLVATWGISSTKAVVSGAGLGVQAVLESGTSNAVVQATLHAGVPNRFGIAFRVQSAGNGLAVQINPGAISLDLMMVSGGVISQIDSAGYEGETDGVLSVAFTHTTVDAYWNGVLRLHVTDVTDFLTETKHGLYAVAPGTSTWDDFSISTVPSPRILLALAPTAQVIHLSTLHTVYGTGNEQGLREEAISYRGAR